MLPLLLLRSGNVNWWRKATIGLGAVVVIMALNIRSKTIDLEQARLAYENPKTVKTEKRSLQKGPTTRREGPSRTETRVTKRPDGTEETVKIETRGPVEETRGPVLETIDTRAESTPVLPPLQLDRWIAGVGPSWRAGEAVDWSVVGGRSWGNRIDLTGEFSQRGRVGAKIAFRF